MYFDMKRNNEFHYAHIFEKDQSDAYIAPDGDGTVVYRLESKQAKRWLSRLSFVTESKAASGEAIRTALLTMEAMADAEGPSIQLNVRVAWVSQVLWYDLGKAAVRINSSS